MNRIETIKWAEAYIRAQKAQAHGLNTDHEDWWAIDEFMCILMNESSKLHSNCWHTILKILETTDDVKVLGFVSAGPLEDLIHTFGELYIERIEAEAKAYPDFRQLLRGVWESGSPEIWARILRARGE